MYLRFTSPLRQGRRGLYMGIFQAAFFCRDEIDMPAYLRSHLVEEIDWFKKYLPSPNSEYFKARPSRNHSWESICWFKASAKQMIDHSWQLKVLIEECGMPLSLLHSRNPGHIAYEDDFQIVAYPRRDAAIKFQ